MHRFFIRSAFPVAVWSSLALVACADASNDSSIEGTDVVNDPVVQRELRAEADPPAKIKVVAPPGAPANARVRIGTLYGNLNEEIGPLRETGVTYWWSLLSYPVITREFTYVAPGSFTTVEASLLSLDIKGVTSPTLGLSKLPMIPAPYVNLSSIINGVATKIHNDPLPLTWDGTVPVALLPGQYMVSFGYDEADGQVVDIPAGETKTIHAWDYAGRQVAKIVAPNRRFATASCALPRAGQTVQYYRLQESISHEIALADGESSAEFGKRAGSYFNYFFTIDGIVEGGYPMQIPIALGEPGQGPRPFRVGRLDIDHVPVPQPDGTTKMVAGTYQVYRKTGTDSSGRDVFASVNLACNASVPTHTGIDVPDGRYKVVVSYSTASGPQKAIDIVDVRGSLP
ncbi:hypothetical protein LVJ94_39665 [Pendulispora rubella]|uniref:Uncharacterized protein n=1 Tax=Pendulispora rubella TaxID=2741070 RepID=A0ABZ2L0C9_9BACT